MRTHAETERVHQFTLALLKRRGINPHEASYDEYAECAEIAAEALAGGATTLAEALGRAAVGDDTPDVTTTRVLAKFATSGKFIRDLSISEEEFLAEAIRVEAEREREILADARAHAERRQAVKALAAEASPFVRLTGRYCTRCEMLVDSCNC